VYQQNHKLQVVINQQILIEIYQQLNRYARLKNKIKFFLWFWETGISP
jgi:hypothetical protein